MLIGVLSVGAWLCAASAPGQALPAGVSIQNLKIIEIAEPSGKNHQQFVELVASDGKKGHAGPMLDFQCKAITRLFPELKRRLAGKDINDSSLDFAELWNGLHPGKPLSAYEQGLDPLTGKGIWGVHRKSRQTKTGEIIAGLSQIDIALWDLRGKVMGQPIYKLLGGSRHSIPVYYTSHPKNAVDQVAIGNRWYEHGFKRQKVQLPFHAAGGATAFQENLKIFDAVHSQCPADLVMAYDFFRNNDQIDATGTREERLKWVCDQIQAVMKYSPYWIEEPVGPEDLEGYTFIKKAIPEVRLALGEHHYTRWNFKPFLDRKLIAVVEYDPEWGGGISEFVAMAQMIKRSYPGVRMLPHGHQLLAAAQCIASQPETLAEGTEYKDLQFSQLHYYKDGGPRAVAGVLTLPDGPGLGIDLDPSRYEVVKEQEWENP